MISITPLWKCPALVSFRRKLFRYLAAVNTLSQIVPRNILNSRSVNIILSILNCIKDAGYSI